MRPELIAHLQVAEWLRQTQPSLLWYHFANERKCSPMQGALLKRMGVVAGVADFFFPRRNKNYSGLWLELKADKGRLSPAQAKFLSDMLAQGYDACVCIGAKAAIEVICNFYGLKTNASEVFATS